MLAREDMIHRQEQEWQESRAIRIALKAHGMNCSHQVAAYIIALEDRLEAMEERLADLERGV